MNWNQIFRQVDNRNRQEHVFKLLESAEVRQRRPVFLRNLYISPRHVKRIVPGNLVFLASVFNIVSQYSAFEKIPNFPAFSMTSNVVLIAMLVAIRVRRVRMEIAR